MNIQTVNGLISSEVLGITLPHEHLIIDYRCAWNEPPLDFAHLVRAKISEELVEQIRYNTHYSQDNLLLDDVDTSVEELMHFKKAGGNAIVDLTTFGLSPNPLKLRQISKQTNLHIIAGCGYYRHIAQTPLTLKMKSDEIAEEIVRSLVVGINGTDIRAGIIGEVGTSYPLHPFERESLIGAAKAQRQTGVAINIHPEIWEHDHLNILDILENSGADLSRTVMSHMDELTESDWHLKVAKRGVYISFDTFGSEFSINGIQEPLDTDRIKCLLTLLEKGYVDKLLLSQDVCYKIQLRRFGGHGYDHILSTIVPLLKKYGVSEVELSKMLIENSARLLAIS